MSNRWSKFNGEHYINDYDKKTFCKHLNENWFEFGQSDKVEVTFAYTYHPCPILDWNGDTPTAAYLKTLNVDAKDFNCEIFEPDVISVQVEIGPCTLLVYGTFLLRLWYVKEAYFSWDQFYTDMKTEFSQKFYDDVSPLINCDKKDARNFRPLSIDVLLAIHNIHGHLVLDSSGDAFPIGFTDRLCLELDKNYNETRLQLYVDPINLFLFDSVKRKYDKNLKQGHLCLSSIQVRGHAMFSDVGRIKTDTLEYGWLLEVLLGDVSGYLTPVQSEQVIHFLETFLNLMLENEYDLKPVYTNRVDPGLPYKYCVTKFSLDSVDIYLAESGTALNIQLFPVRLSMCNSHTKEYAKGLSVYIQEIKLKQYLNEANRSVNNKNLNETLTNETSTHSGSPLSNKRSNRSTPTNRRTSSASTVSISSLSSNDSSISSFLNNNNNNNNKNESLIKNRPFGDSAHQHIPDSSEFNYWFEVSSIQTGQITLDMQLDKGEPVEQIKFLRLHDERTKRLYFLWDSYYDYDLKENRTRPQGDSIKCGCNGGCYFYNVGNNDYYFKVPKSLTRTTNYAKSLFNPKVMILNSHRLMKEKYEVKYYKYQLLDEKNVEFNHKIQKQAQQPSSVKPRRNSVSSTSNSNKNNAKKSHNVSKVVVTAPKLERAYSSSNQNDDYFTADEENNSGEDDRSLRNSNRETSRFIRINSVASSIASSFVSVNEDTLKGNNSVSSNDDEQITVLERPSRLILKKQDEKVNNDDDADNDSNGDSNGSVIIKDSDEEEEEEEEAEEELGENQVEEDDIDLDMAAQHSKLTLKFDIQKPILESVLPKYCYLKHLSRARVKNWNLMSKFPNFNEFKQNISFQQIQSGFSCNLLKKNPFDTKTNSSSTNRNATSKPQAATSNDDVNCRVNLCFTSTIECYITPLILCCLERYVKALKAYKLNTHTMLTEVDAKCQANCASDSIIGVISRTQISLTIPEIRFCSLQVGLAEDKTSMLIDTLVHPDQLVNLSLFTICVHSIETQVSDSKNLKAAIFKINKIDSQFRRLHTDIAKQDQRIRLSCIANERSKVSFQCFNSSNDVSISNSPGSIMYECAFEEISIKAIRKFRSTFTTNKKNEDDDVPSRTSLSTTSTYSDHSNRTLINEEEEENEMEETKGNNNNKEDSRISLCEFDISEIWFSFPEPPISPKGKRKIPYTRYEWNLLSSISPAVISWQCASKHVRKPFKQYLIKHDRNLLQTLAALLTGSLKNEKDLLLLSNESQNKTFLKYLTESALLYNKDINCRLIKILRLYLLNYSNELQTDLSSKQIPDIKSLKRGINEVLNRWSILPIGIGCSPVNDESNFKEKYQYVTEIRETNEAFNTNNHHKHSTIQKNFNVNPGLNLLHSFNNATLSSSNLSSDESNFDASIGFHSSFQQQQQHNPAFNDSTLNFNPNNGKTETLLNHPRQQQQQQQQQQQSSNKEGKTTKKLQSHLVGPITYTNINRLFKPILNYIGIDVPSGTLVDNLFKEFGCYLIGNLNIKSVYINILGNGRKFTTESSLNVADSSNKNRKSTGIPMQKASSVTTILSFDSLVLNINIRQVLPNDANIETLMPDTERFRRKSTIKSLNNNLAAVFKSPKYFTKVDTSIKLNNLTQEVNMPLLRLAHQLYSIVADAIEYDKDEIDWNNAVGIESIDNSSNELTARKLDSRIKYQDLDYEYNLSDNENELESGEDEVRKNQDQQQKFIRKHQSKPSNQSINKDCWTFMNSVVQLKDKPQVKISGAPYSGKDKIYDIKNLPEGDTNLVSLFGWININKIKSRAGIGTLTYSGEMKNVQASIMFGKKFQGIVSNKKHYEGSLNLRMGSTSGTLSDNSTQNVVVQMGVGKSHTFVYLKKLNLKHLISSFVHIGKISVDVPLRPMDVHNFVYRESKVIELKLLQEFKNVIFDPQQQQSSGSTQNNLPGSVPTPAGTTPADGGYYDDGMFQSTVVNEVNRHKKNQYSTGSGSRFDKPSIIKRNVSNGSLRKNEMQQQQLPQQQLNRFYFNLKSKFDGCDIRAKLLEKPSLKAAYTMNNIELIASLNAGKSKLTCILYEHYLSFESDNLNPSTTPSGPPPHPPLLVPPLNANLNHSASYINLKQQQQQQQQHHQVDENENSTRTTFDLPGIEVNGFYNSKITETIHLSSTTPHHHHHQQQQVLPIAKQQTIDIELNVKVSQLHRELNADVIAQLVFVTNIFIKEINYILQAIYSIDNFKPKANQAAPLKLTPSVSVKQQQQQQQQTAASESLTTKIFYKINVDIAKITITAITPTFTSLSICTGDKNNVYLTNNFTQNEIKYPKNEYTLKPSVKANCNIIVDLKTCLSKQDESKFDPSKQSKNQRDKNIDDSAEYDEDWYQLALFDTKIDLQNTISISKSKEHDREAIIIMVDNPRFYLQPGAVDNAILFWLNYKSTYESWLNKRKKFADLYETAGSSVPVSSRQPSAKQPTNITNNSDNNFLVLKLRVSKLGLALPLSNKPTKDFKTNSDSLVITLNETSINACSSGCVVSKGQFNNFCLRFVENFNLTSLDWMPIVAPVEITKREKIPLNTLVNAWVVPSGVYEVCSSTIQNIIEPTQQNKTS